MSAIFTRTRIYPTPPAADIINVNELGAVDVGNYLTATANNGSTTAANNFSTLQPFPVSKSGSTGGTASTIDEADYDYTNPLEGVELSGWT